MDIAKYIGETTEYDKKQEVERRKVKSWLKSVSAFANGGGGCLLFGIADDDTIIGLTDAKTDAEFISQKIKERIDPVPQIDLKIERVEDKELLILHVHGGEDTPYYYIGDSVLETFVRIGNESVVADSTEHKRLVLRGRNSSFDARPSDEMFEDYAFSKLRSRYMERKGSGMGKIINPIKALPYFEEKMLPTFFSDRAQFTVTFPNMILAWQETHPNIEVNFVENEGDTQGVPQGVPQDGTQDGTQGGTQSGTQSGTQGDDLDKWIEYQVAVYPKITTEELASLSGKGLRTIKRRIAKMPHIEFVGSGYSGHWEVKPKKK